MKYCTFKYRIEYADDSKYEGWSPYHGYEIGLPQLQKFVNDFFREVKPARKIEIFDIFEITDPRIWITHVRNTVEFRYLYMAKGFAVDLLQKFYPEEVR